MEVNEIGPLCIESCERYLEYLTKNDQGIEKIPILEKTRFEGSILIWGLTIGKKLFNSDSVTIRNLRFNETYSDEDFLVESYDENTHHLVIKLTRMIENFRIASSGELQIVVDLKFFVKNVANWFQNNGHTINPPRKDAWKLNVDLSNDFSSPNFDQVKAIENCLISPLSYVWGPPGTGKTKLVLTDSVFGIRKMDESAIVGVFAPTNNALEQAMGSLILRADKMGISRDKFIRLGSPSKEFALNFPEVCEVAGIEKKRREISSQIGNIKKVQLFRKGLSAINSVSHIVPLLDKIEEQLRLRDSQLLVSGRLKRERYELEKNTKKLLQLIKSKVFKKETAIDHALNSNRTEIEENQVRLQTTEDEIGILLGKIERIEIQSQKIIDLRNKFHLNDVSGFRDDLRNIRINTEEYFLPMKALALQYERKNNEEIDSFLLELQQQLKELEASSTGDRLKKSFVIGCTLDSFVGRFQNGKPDLHHIFIDEAGYLPLIKALPLFSYNVPITLLGDHRQLPPICEMDYYSLKSTHNESVWLWVAPSIYCSVAFTLSRPLFFEALKNNKAEYYSVSISILSATHRFGASLSKILDELFYKFGFESANNGTLQDVEVIVVDAPMKLQTSQRKNESECAAIKKIIKGDNLGDFIILTPYTRQLALLKSNLPSLSRDSRVMTVHASQGREWDTVILSVVDSPKTRTPWFTDTNNTHSRGANVMNTALSRVKKNLIIVCDQEYWKNHPGKETQLISRIISIAKTIQV